MPFTSIGRPDGYQAGGRLFDPCSPRQHHATRHVEDYVAALDYIRGPDLAGVVDSSRIGLWGTSFSGGHVLNVAAADDVPSTVGEIRAIVSQVNRIMGSSGCQFGEVVVGGSVYCVTCAHTFFAKCCFTWSSAAT